MGENSSQTGFSFTHKQSHVVCSNVTHIQFAGYTPLLLQYNIVFQIALEFLMPSAKVCASGMNALLSM